MSCVRYVVLVYIRVEKLQKLQPLIRVIISGVSRCHVNCWTDLSMLITDCTCCCILYCGTLWAIAGCCAIDAALHYLPGCLSACLCGFLPTLQLITHVTGRLHVFNLISLSHPWTTLSAVCYCQLVLLCWYLLHLHSLHLQICSGIGCSCSWCDCSRWEQFMLLAFFVCQFALNEWICIFI